MNHVITIRDVAIVGGVALGLAAIGGCVLWYFAALARGMRD